MKVWFGYAVDGSTGRPWTKTAAYSSIDPTVNFHEVPL